MNYDVRKLEIDGAYVLIPNIFRDERGTITKTFFKDSFNELGIQCNWGESLITENYKKGIVRGFHFQRPPYTQAKTICCITGSIKNWILDIRKNSKTYGKIIETNLDAESRQIMYVPMGVANCYYICEDNTIISYNLTGKYEASSADGINCLCFDLGLDQNVIFSEKDMMLQKFDTFETPFIYGENC